MSKNINTSQLPIPLPFVKSVRGGVQVKGWEGVNLEKVARNVGVGGQYLREVVKGNRPGSIILFTRFGDVMGWEGLGVDGVLGELVRRRGNGNGNGNNKDNGHTPKSKESV